ncbi:MAG: sigma-70 family RNA polymerase sigma factor [Kiritimatiellae bacterium]|nr:sigma-70 family RNA polymerase sigma factor [Kiritimatiellia bacterium]
MTYRPFLNEKTRSSVLAGVKTGTEAAWGRFFDIYAGYVFALARRSRLSSQDADEIVQRIFLELAAPGGFDGYERGKGSFRQWLKRKVEWRIADEHRRSAARANIRYVTPDALDTVPANDSHPRDEAWIEAARAEAMRRLRASSTQQHFAIFQASVVEEIPAEEIVSLYGVTRDNLYQIRRRMTAAFRRHLEAALADLDSPDLP